MLILKDFLSYSLKQQSEHVPFDVRIGDHTRAYSPVAGVVCFEPMMSMTEPSKHIVLSSGVHGNETAPIEICNSIIRDIASESIKLVHPVMFIFGNLPAIKKQTRFIQENLNRLFSPDIDASNFERKRAIALMEAVSNFFSSASGERHHYDLHTAIRDSKNEKFAIYPYTQNSNIQRSKQAKSELRFMSDCGVNTILLTESTTPTFSYYSSFHHQAHTFTVELGKVKPFGQNDMSRFEKVSRMLRRLLQEEVLNLTPFEQCPLLLYEVSQTINKQFDDFRLHFNDDLANFSTFKKGSVLASEGASAGSGGNKIEYSAQQDGEAIVFPNADVAIGQRAMLTVVPCKFK